MAVMLRLFGLLELDVRKGLLASRGLGVVGGVVGFRELDVMRGWLYCLLWRGSHGGGAVKRGRAKGEAGEEQHNKGAVRALSGSVVRYSTVGRGSVTKSRREDGLRLTACGERCSSVITYAREH